MSVFHSLMFQIENALLFGALPADDCLNVEENAQILNQRNNHRLEEN